MKKRATAILTIHNAGQLTQKERVKLAGWLADQAISLREDGNNLTDGTYRARYYAKDKLTRRRG